MANRDEHVAGPNLLIAAGIKKHLTVGAPDGHHHDIQLGTNACFEQLLVNQRR